MDFQKMSEHPQTPLFPDKATSGRRPSGKDRITPVAAAALLLQMVALGLALGMAGAGAALWLSAPAICLAVDIPLILFARRRQAASLARFEALKRSERHYRYLLHSMPDEILLIDRDLRIRDMNRDRLTIADQDRADIIGRPCMEILRPADPDGNLGELWAKIERVFQSQSPCKCRQEIRAPQGERAWKDLRLSPLINGDGGASGAHRVILAMRDVTREVSLEGQLRQAQKMEAIGTLAGGIAHDFNNHLMTIILNIEYAARHCEKMPAVAESLHMALTASERARDLVDQILTFSRKNERVARPLMIEPIIKESLKMIRSSLPATIELDQQIMTETDAVMAEPGQIQQIVINLCANAAQAITGGKGRITVSLAEEQVTSGSETPGPAPGDYLRLTVSDTGRGMDPGLVRRIFDPFFTTKPPGQGVGMGLSLVHGIVRSLNGAIEVKSAPEKGSRFDVYLPRLKEPVRPEAPLPLPCRANGGRVLIVDDEETVVNVVMKTLGDVGYLVTGETDPLRALSAFEADPLRFDLVITDLTMPQLTGEELSRKLLQLRPDLPIILTTGYGELISSEQAREAGIRAIMSKPVTAGKLISHVNTALAEN